jgi:hypothetical protein
MRILHHNSMNMKKHFTYLIAIYTLIIVAMPACDKDDDDPQPKTKTELITSGSWKLSTATEGATKCNAGDPNTTPFTWNFQDSETKLFVSSVLFTGGNNTSTIVTLSETQLVLSQEVIFGGTPYTAIVTFIH